VTKRRRDTMSYLNYLDNDTLSHVLTFINPENGVFMFLHDSGRQFIIEKIKKQWLQDNCFYEILSTKEKEELDNKTLIRVCIEYDVDPIHAIDNLGLFFSFDSWVEYMNKRKERGIKDDQKYTKRLNEKLISSYINAYLSHAPATHIHNLTTNIIKLHDHGYIDLSVLWNVVKKINNINIKTTDERNDRWKNTKPKIITVKQKGDKKNKSKRKRGRGKRRPKRNIDVDESVIRHPLDRILSFLLSFEHIIPWDEFTKQLINDDSSSFHIVCHMKHYMSYLNWDVLRDTLAEKGYLAYRLRMNLEKAKQEKINNGEEIMEDDFYYDQDDEDYEDKKIISHASTLIKYFINDEYIRFNPYEFIHVTLRGNPDYEISEYRNWMINKYFMYEPCDDIHYTKYIQEKRKSSFFHELPKKVYLFDYCYEECPHPTQWE